MGQSIFQSLGQAGNNMRNPYQMMQQMSQAMANPAAFLKQRFPDIPDQIMNNPWQIMQYLQQSRGMSQEQIQQIGNQAMPQYQMYQNQFK